MKATISFCLLMLTSSISHTQADTSINGIWKIVSIEMAGIYYNFNKDSISLSGEIKPLTDEDKQKQIAATLKMVYAVSEFHFEKNGILKQHRWEKSCMGLSK